VVSDGADPVAPVDVPVLFASGTAGAPTADDWAPACETLNYQTVTRIGSTRVPRTYGDGEGT